MLSQFILFQRHFIKKKFLPAIKHVMSITFTYRTMLGKFRHLVAGLCRKVDLLEFYLT